MAEIPAYTPGKDRPRRNQDHASNETVPGPAQRAGRDLAATGQSTAIPTTVISTFASTWPSVNFALENIAVGWLGEPVPSSWSDHRDRGRRECCSAGAGFSLPAANCATAGATTPVQVRCAASHVFDLDAISRRSPTARG